MAKLEGREFECTSDADCVDTPNWFCGLEQRCKERAAPRTRACRDSSECATDWRCGPTSQPDGGVCVDTSTGSAAFCRTDAGQADCFGGWRCGADERCFDPAVEGERPCSSDDDCAQAKDYRCNALVPRSCVKLSDDALRATSAFTGSLTIDSPRLVPESRSGALGTFRPFGAIESRYFISDGGLFESGGKLLGVQPAGTLPPGATQIALSRDSKYILAGTQLTRRTAAGEETTTLPSGQQWALRSIGVNADPDVRQVTGVVAFSATEIRYYSDARALNAVQNIALPNVVTALRDFSDFTPGNGTTTLLASGREGLFVSELLPDGGFRDLTGGVANSAFWVAIGDSVLQNKALACRGPGWKDTLPTPGRIAATSGYALVELVQAGAASQFTALKWDSDTIVGTSDCQTSGPERFLHSSPTAVCSATARWLKALRSESGNPDPRFLVECGDQTTLSRAAIDVSDTADGGIALQSAAPDDSPLALFPDEARGELTTAVSTTGVLVECDPLTCEPAMFTGPTKFLGGGADAGIHAVDVDGRLYFGQSELGPERVGRFVSTKILFPNEPQAPVVGDETLMIDVAGSELFLRRLSGSQTLPATSGPGSFENATDVIALLRSGAANAFAVKARSRSGAELIIAAAGDRIWAGTFGAPADRIQVRVVPFPLGRITSLTVEQPAAGEVQLSGYVLVQDRVFSITADTLTRWRSQELTLPLPEESTVGVWSDKDRSRVTFAHGQTFSLPSMVELTRGAHSATFRQVVGFCGTGWARSSSEVYRLEQGASAQEPGEWRSVTLPFNRPVDATTRYSNGYLLPAGNSLYVSDSVGNIVRITESNCP